MRRILETQALSWISELRKCSRNNIQKPRSEHSAYAQFTSQAHLKLPDFVNRQNEYRKIRDNVNDCSRNKDCR